jgi:hypothetical protein
METGGVSRLTKIGTWIPPRQSRLLISFLLPAPDFTHCLHPLSLARRNLRIHRFSWSAAAFLFAAPNHAEFASLLAALNLGHRIWSTAMNAGSRHLLVRKRCSPRCSTRLQHWLRAPDGLSGNAEGSNAPHGIANRHGVRCRRSVLGLASACALFPPLLIAWMRFLELIILMAANRKKDITC